MEEATKLFVGEREFNVDAARIVKEFPGSYLAKLFQNNPDQTEFFIDRDGDVFVDILQYLRTGNFPVFDYETLDERVNRIVKIRNEANFYLLEELSQTCSLFFKMKGSGAQFMHVRANHTEVIFTFAENYKGLIFNSAINQYQEVLSQNLKQNLIKGYKIDKIQVLSDKGSIPETIYFFQ